MRITDELVSTHIYSILHSISIQKRVELKVEILKLIIRYSKIIIRIFEYYSIFQKGLNMDTLQKTHKAYGACTCVQEQQ